MNEIDDIHVILLNPKMVKSQTAAKIIIFIGKYRLHKVMVFSPNRHKTNLTLRSQQSGGFDKVGKIFIPTR